MKAPKNTNGVIYARYSSHRQKELSNEQQIAMCRKLAKENGITVIKVYPDKAKSGKTDKRPFFQQMMQDAATRSFGYVLAWKSNRIGRNMIEALMNEEKLRKYGVKIIYVEEDFDDTAAGRFAARSMMNVNQFYSENMAEDITRGMRANAEKCLVTNGQPPLGYLNIKKQIVLDPVGAEIVREIYDRFNSGETYADIALALNNEGKRTGTGGAFRPNSFHRILRNERYRGIYIYDDIRIDGGLPRIIDDSTFFLAQKNLERQAAARHRHRDTVLFMLTGKIFCGHCGEAMTGTSGTSKNGAKHYYYICRQKKKGLCDKRPVKKDAIETAVAEAIKDNILQPEVIEWIIDAAEKYAKSRIDAPEVAEWVDELKEVTASLDNIVAAFEKGISSDVLRERLESLEARKKELERLLNYEAAMQYTFKRDDARRWLLKYKDGDVNDPQFQKDLFDTFLTAVYVYDDGRIKIVFNLYGGTSDEITLSDVNAADVDGVRINNTVAHQSYNPRTQAEIIIFGKLLILSVFRGICEK